jgi:four helix bundle protein
MPAIKNFFELDCWRESKDIYLAIRKFIEQNEIRKEYYLKDQLLRASLSISNNIVEGFERGGKKEFRRFLIIANGSASEVKSMPLLLMEVENYMDKNEIEVLIRKIEDCMKMTKALIRYLNKELNSKH